MLKLIQLILYRIIHNKANLMLYIVLVPLVMSMAIYFTNHISHHMNIGIVGHIDIVTNDDIQYTYLDEVPKTSQMILNEYDAVVIQQNNHMKVLSTKGEEFNQMIPLLITGQIHSLSDSGDQRGNATQIIGFLMMVVSLLGVQIYAYYFDERKGINKRILQTSIHCYEYMLSHFIVVLSFLFIPAVVILCGAILVFDIVLSMTLWQFILVFFLLCFFASAFGLWINACSKTLEESMMIGNMIAIIGSIVSGGFVQVTNNSIFNHIIQFLPQRQIMLLLSALENNAALPTLGVIYTIMLCIVFMITAIIIEKRKLPVRE